MVELNKKVSYNHPWPTVHLSATSQLSKQRPETEFVKDEYFVYNVENSDNSDHIDKFTHWQINC
jgi:hypothetical protein